MFRTHALASWQTSHDRLSLESESELESLYDWRFTTNQFVLTTSPEGITKKFFFSNEHFRS
jgi:hypothetical protein